MTYDFDGSTYETYENRRSSMQSDGENRPSTRSDRENRPSTRSGRAGVAAGLSWLLPGAGQFYAGRVQIGIVLILPLVLLLSIIALAAASGHLASVAALAVVPGMIVLFIIGDLAFAFWRSIAVLDAYVAYKRQVSRLAVVFLVAVTVTPHLVIAAGGVAFAQTTDKIFVPLDTIPFAITATSPDPNAASAIVMLPTPGPTPQGQAPGLDLLVPLPTATPMPKPSFAAKRITVLLIGFDSGPGRTNELTDTQIVASFDPVGGTVSLVSIPRDTVGVPLGNGRAYAPKINSLYAYAAANPSAFGGATPIRVLKDTLGAFVGVSIDYYAAIDLPGFIRVIDATGGVDINVKTALNDPRYKEYGFRGIAFKTGCQHMDGQTALAYARIRYSEGQNDFTRADRQQQVLMAVRNKLVGAGTIANLPSILASLGDTIRTDIPPDLVASLTSAATSVTTKNVYRAVLSPPLVSYASNEYGSVLIPDRPAIDAVAAALFPETGAKPASWPAPTPRPTVAPGTTPKPKATPGPVSPCAG